MDEAGPAMKYRLAAEAVGTFALVFAGTAAIVVNDLSGGIVTHVGVSLTFGLVVAAMVYAIGDVSGAHINPAVTLGFWLARRLPGRSVVPYVGAQAVGALAGSLLVLAVLGPHPTLGATEPVGSVSRSFGLEVVLTFLLMFTILHVSTGAKEKGAVAGMAIGAAVALGALVGGPVSGASMNPARSLAPAVVSVHLEFVWLYVLAPCIGAGCAVIAARLSRASG